MTTTKPTGWVFRPGALEHIMRTRNLHTDEQLTAAIGVTREGLEKIRAGFPVTTELALKVSALQGDRLYIDALFEPYTPQAA